MNTIAEIFNLIDCGSSGVIGTGLAACSFDLNNPSTILLVPKGTKMAPNFVFSLANIQEKIQTSGWVVLQGITDFVDGTPDNDRKTYASTGNMRTMLKHPYLWTFTTDNGINFFKALTYLDGNNQWDIIVFDTEGNGIASLDKQGNGRGLNMGMFDTGKYVIGNDHMQSFTVQVNRQNFDKTVCAIEGSNLDFVPADDLDGFNDVTITPSPLATTATALVFKAMLIDNTHLLAGAVDANFRITRLRAGTTTVSTHTGLSYTTNPGYITTTLGAAAASGDVYTIETWDPTLSVEIINIDGILYKGPQVTVIVT